MRTIELPLDGEASGRTSPISNDFPVDEQASSSTWNSFSSHGHWFDEQTPSYTEGSLIHGHWLQAAPAGFPPAPEPHKVPLSDFESLSEFEICSSHSGYAVSAVIRNTPLNLLNLLKEQLKHDRLDDGANKHVAELNLRISRTSNQPRNGYYEFCRIIQWAFQHSKQHLTSITVSLPSNFPSQTTICDDSAKLIVSPSLCTFEWGGRLDLLPNPLVEQFKCLENLSLTHCQLSIPDCLHVLRNAPTLKTFALAELAHTSSIFTNNNGRQTKVVLTRLKELNLNSSINPSALFSAIEIHKLCVARLRFSSDAAVHLPLESIPWTNMTSFVLFAPRTDETIFRELWIRDTNAMMEVVLNGTVCHRRR